MGELIQITGLPRSGTAFMATFFALNPDCVSFHELITKNDNYRNEIENQLKFHKFVIDASTYGFLPQCSYKDSKKVFLDRNPSDSLKSAEIALKTKIDKSTYNQYLEQIKNWKGSNEVLNVKFGELFKVPTLKIVWMYCFGSDKYFSEEKANHFIEMNIQMRNPESIFEQRVFKRINKQLCQH
jgi:hypothetical protein